MVKRAINFARRPNGARPTKVEAAILAEIRAKGGIADYIENHGPETDRTINRLLRKGWIVNSDNKWSVSKTAP